MNDKASRSDGIINKVLIKNMKLLVLILTSTDGYERGRRGEGDALAPSG